MTLLKKLLLFGGVPAAGASAAAAPFVLKQLKKEKAEVQVENSEEFDENIEDIDLASIEDKNDIEAEKQKALLWAAGLKCKKSFKEGSICTPIENKGLRLKVNGKVEEGFKFSGSSTGKLVLRKNKNTYSYGLRLSVEAGDIALEASGKTNQKLERFESYGLEAEGQGAEKKLYLVKKQTHQEGVMRVLGIIPSNCKLPLDRITKECSLSSEEIKSVRFDGRKEGGATISNTSQKTTLKISKSVDSNLFKEGYRFAFSSSGAEITINNGNVIRTNASTEFTVKDWKDEEMVLVRAGSGEKEKDFFNKVGLKCTGNAGNETCSIEEEKLNVIKGDSSNESNKLTAGKKTGGNGTIKLHRDQANYINGLKFSIEEGDITISGKPENSHIKRLSQFDGYEIVETGGKFYLKRKEEGLAEIVKKLGIFENPSSDVENTSEPILKTTVSSPQSNKIKFYAENKEVSPVGTAAIDVHGYRTTDTTNYKYGYRFTLKPAGDITIGSTNLKKDVTYDFKIREEGGNLSLERTIDPEKIIGLLGLSCNQVDGAETCTFQSGKANVRHWGDKKNVINANAENQGETVKLKLTKDQPGFTDGFMFTVEGGDITFTGGTVNTGNIRMAEFEKYEIQLKDGIWYLYQKKNFMQEKYSDLGIKEKCNNEFYSYCEMEATSEASNLKFKVKKDKNVKTTFSSGAKVLIKLKKDPQITTGIKVAMMVGGGGDDGRHFSVVCNSGDSKTLLKLTKEETIFKIEKEGSSFFLAKEGGEESNETCPAPSSK